MAYDIDWRTGFLVLCVLIVDMGIGSDIVHGHLCVMVKCEVRCVRGFV